MEEVVLLLPQVITVYYKTSFNVYDCLQNLVEVIFPELSKFVIPLKSLYQSDNNLCRAQLKRKRTQSYFA
jgi:hypothetical protein